MRTEQRKNELGEVFTPPKLCREILGKLPRSVWRDRSKTWLDPSCGNGNFLVEVKERLLKNKKTNKCTEKHILEEMIFGVDIMPDNIEECILRLWGEGGEVKERETTLEEARVPGIIAVFLYRKPGQKWKLVRNIVCADGLIYDYSFGRPPDNPENWSPELVDVMTFQIKR